MLKLCYYTQKSQEILDPGKKSFLATQALIWNVGVVLIQEAQHVWCLAY